MVDNSPPELESLVYEPYCGSSSLTIQFTEAVWCSSVQPEDFVLTGPNGTYDINSTHSIVCAAASSNTYAGTWYDDVWTLELDDYLSHSGDYVLSILSGSSISLAIVTPSLVTTGEPNPLSKMTFDPLGPRVILTALANLSTPFFSDCRAFSSKRICFAILI